MFDYGRYTPYVLTSYGIAAVVLIGLVVWTVMRVTNAKKKLEAIEPSNSLGKKDAAP
ncbi:MAG: heme exporter protein CcmD [Burkholderiales bacterium]|nr:MAG: heme exporter protein CcmD [Burkholderiales bacterium]